MLKITEHAIKRYIERIEKCSLIEAEFKIREIYVNGKIIAKKRKQIALQYNNAILIIENEGSFTTIKTVEHINFNSWWKVCK